MSDGQGGSATASVTVTVTSVNDAPIAVADSASTNGAFAVTIDVLSNDSDPDGDTLTVDSLTQPTNGSVEINADQTVRYTPVSNYSGSDNFSYTVADGTGATDTASVTVSVNVMVPPGPDHTVLVANLMNGNNEFFNSRVYLWNPSPSAGEVTVRVFTLPHTGESWLLGTLDLGVLEASTARNIKLAEDILTPLAILLPYITDGGNLTLEFTIEAPNVRGVGQVFDHSLTVAFGTYPLQEVLSTSTVNPTVLVANFMNGNNSFFNSHVSLWNPSVTAGEVSVRVFTLPLVGGLAQELTVTPLNLGTLGAESARSIRLAEDVLTPLGIPLPYMQDGGNLTLEFTIEAPNVQGAAQVFSTSLSFGTYPLQ